MSEGLSKSASLWALAGAIPFLLSIGFLGLALSNGLLVAFAIGWPIIQVLGYWGSLKRSGGQIDHPLVKTQVMLHWLMLAILVATFARAL